MAFCPLVTHVTRPSALSKCPGTSLGFLQAQRCGRLILPLCHTVCVVKTTDLIPTSRRRVKKCGMHKTGNDRCAHNSYTLHVLRVKRDEFTSKYFQRPFSPVVPRFQLRTTRTFYLSIIQSTLDYASSAYFHCLHTNTYNKILTTNRICMRRIFGLHRCTHFNFVLQKYNLHSIENRANLKLFLFVYCCLNWLTSSLITPIFPPRPEASRTRAVTRGQVNSGLALLPVFTRYGLTSFFSGGRKVEPASSRMSSGSISP